MFELYDCLSCWHEDYLSQDIRDLGSFSPTKKSHKINYNVKLMLVICVCVCCVCVGGCLGTKKFVFQEKEPKELVFCPERKQIPKIFVEIVIHVSTEHLTEG